jgi:hypothetical protein
LARSEPLADCQRAMKASTWAGVVMAGSERRCAPGILLSYSDTEALQTAQLTMGREMRLSQGE